MIACGESMIIKKQPVPSLMLEKIKEFQSKASKPFFILKDIRSILLKKDVELETVWKRIISLEKGKEKDKKNKRSSFSSSSLSFGYRVYIHDYDKSPLISKEFLKKATGGHTVHYISCDEYYKISRVTRNLFSRMADFQESLNGMVSSFEDLYLFLKSPSFYTLEILEYLAAYSGDLKAIIKTFHRWDIEFEKQKITNMLFEVESTLLLIIGDFLVPMFGNPVIEEENDDFVLFNRFHMDMMYNLLVNDSIGRLMEKMNLCLSVKLFTFFSEIWSLPKCKRLF